MDEPQPGVTESLWPATLEGRMMALVDGFELSQAVYVVAKLGVPDRLAGGPRSAEDLAAELGVAPDPLYRVLRLLAALDVLATDADGKFGLTSLGDCLRTDHPGSIAPRAIFLGEEMYRAAGDLLHTVRTGETAFQHVFGLPQFEYLGTHPEANAVFNAAMVARRSNWSALTEAYDFSRHRTVVDVGGGHGAVLASLLRAAPGLHGVLFDLPHVVAGAGDYLAAQGVRDRVRLEAGSVFESIPAGADLYLEVAVMHLFPDGVARRVLANFRRAMPSDATLVLVELVVPAGGTPSPSKLLDLRMLYASGGRERTSTEWHALLASSGFDLERIEPTPLPPSLLVARPRAGPAPLPG